MDEPECPGCREHLKRLTELEARVAELTRKLEEATRAGKRQAAPFRKGPPKPDPKKPGRKAGDAHGAHGHRPIPPGSVAERHEATLPDACPHCCGPLIETGTAEQFLIQAVGLSIGVLAVMLFLFGTGVIRATEKFKIGVVAATGAICLVYLVSMVVSLFGSHLPYIHEAGPIGIGFSLVVVVIAALNLILDFDFIEQGVKQQAPKYMEWYGGFSLLVTLVWMYLEILRLLAKLRGNNRD